VKETKPELIEIIEGPTPEFRPSPQHWNQSIIEGPDDRLVGLCELRTMKGTDIVDRCMVAWDEGRPVKLDYPDSMRMRQQADVVAMRLQQLEEGPMLQLWVSLPFDEEAWLEAHEDEDDDFDFDDLEDDDDDDSFLPF
jgi:hypothetical protein